MAIRQRIQRRVVTSGPMRGVIAGSKRLYVPGFGKFTLFDVWGPFIQQLRKANLFERAAAISFNIFMAIPPTLIFIFTLIPFLPISDRFIMEIFSLIRDIVPGEKNNSIIIGFLNDFLNQPRNELLSFGLLLAILFSSNAMMGIMRSFDKNYPGFVRRRTLRKRKVALLLSLTILALVFSCLLLLIAHEVVLKWVGIETAWVLSLIQNLRWIFIILLVFVSVSFIYRHAPALVAKWPFITPGSVFATSLMVLATALVSFWVNNFNNYNKLYGSISAVFILMSLIYVNALVILIGFELNVTLSSLKAAEANGAKSL
ncbi:MAG TPA: YihY/virulence factor BrkB family protein [Flavisolibacter sp.]|nr:YihY/virulence factor BrkB family protein [Flavisolibacter sp.]